MSKANTFSQTIIDLIFLSFVWWLLTREDYASWWMGLPAILLIVLFKKKYIPNRSWKINLWLVFPFIFFFIRQSLFAGWDVIVRALHPRRPLDPGFIQYEMKIQNPFAQIFFVNIISLLPGTFSADVSEQSVDIHVLDQNLANHKALSRLEKSVAQLFCEETLDA